MDVGQLTAQVLDEPPLVRRVEVGEEQADRDRLGARGAKRLCQAAGLTVIEWLEDPSGPIRSAASKRSSASTSGVGFGAQRR